MNPVGHSEASPAGVRKSRQGRHGPGSRARIASRAPARATCPRDKPSPGARHPPRGQANLPAARRLGLILDLPLVRIDPNLANCRERLRDVALHSGGEHVAAMIGEAKLSAQLSSSPRGLRSELPLRRSCLPPSRSSFFISRRSCTTTSSMRRRNGEACRHFISLRAGRALVVGDLLIVAAFDELSRLRTAVSDEVFAGSVEALSRGARLCCVGQLEELDPRQHVRRRTISRRRCEEDGIALLRRGIARRADRRSRRRGSRRACNARNELGVAYQIRDDLRDGAGNERWQRRAASSPGHAGGVSGFSATSATYARAVRSVFGELDGLPASCSGELRGLVEAMVGSSAVADGHEQNG